MHQVFGYRWSNQYGDADDGTWLDGLSDMSREQLAIGMARVRRTASTNARGEAWPPNLVEFRQGCALRMEDFGLPKEIDAFHEAYRVISGTKVADWSHPAVGLAAQEVKWRNYSDEAGFRHFEELYPEFRYAYGVLCRRVMAGERMEAPVPRALPRTVFVRTPEKKDRAVANIRQVLANAVTGGSRQDQGALK